MSTTALYISANKRYGPEMNLDDLRDTLSGGGWRVSVTKARSADVAIAFVDGVTVGAWRLLDAYRSDILTDKSGRLSVNLVLGSALPIDPEWIEIPKIRRGVGVAIH